MTGDGRGFSLVELVVAMGVLMVVMASVFGALSPAQSAFRAQPESADVQQRLRVAVDTLARELMPAGAGAVHGPDAGPSHRFFASILPYRQGRRSADPPGIFKMDTLTVLRVETGAAQTTIAQPLSARSSSVQINLDPGCPEGDLACGFKAGMEVLVFDDTSAVSLFTIAAIQGSVFTLIHNFRDSGRVFPAGTSRMVEATSRAYFLKTDRAADTVQLMQYDGAGGADVPVLDHVVKLTVDYLGDPITASSAGPSLTRLSSTELTDGPWRPDGLDPNRFDADLLRVRAVAVTIRVEAAPASLRGPAGPMFARAGTSRGARVPDQEIRVTIAPPNLSRAR